MNTKHIHNKIGAKALGEIFNSLETAVIYYDADGYLAGANSMSWKLIPDLRMRAPHFNDFISFVYDCSLDLMDQTGLSSSFGYNEEGTAFYEIIELGKEKFYLVRAVGHADTGMIIELSDISIIKNSTDNARLLDNSNKILTEAIQSSQKGIFIAENGGQNRIIFANNALDILLEREGVPLVGYNVKAFLSSQFAPEWGSIEKTIESHQKGIFWRKCDRTESDTKWLSLNLSAESHCGEQHLIIGFISDETQNKMQENHLRQTQKLEAIGKLAGGVAHDFNNILSIVEGYIRLSESALKRGEDITANFTRIKQAVTRGSGLTKQLLMFGKHRVTDNRVVDLCAQVSDMEKFLEPLLGANIHLNISTPQNPIPVKVTPDAISQIVMNLVLNARDAMTEGGEITVSIDGVEKDENSFAILKISDTGSGIPPHIIDKIFDPFFTTKEQGKGTGLGLSMVYGLVQQMGGEIKVSSVSGEGTDFIIHIPITKDSELTAMDKNSLHNGVGVSGKTILIAEDEPDLLNIMEATLKDFNMNVLTAKNGNEALEIQDEYNGKIDFLLTDVVMPKLGGLKLAELMKEVRPDTHIVYMSGYPVRGEFASVDIPKDAIFMAKPVKPDYLRNILEQVSTGQAVKLNDATMWQS